jgi:hypothetical protein
MSTHSITLNDQFAALTPQERAHLSELATAAIDGKLWELFFGYVLAPETTANWFDQALEHRDRSSFTNFTIVGRQRVN